VISIIDINPAKSEVTLNTNYLKVPRKRKFIRMDKNENKNDPTTR
jgi:hypothetical protein